MSTDTNPEAVAGSAFAVGKIVKVKNCDASIKHVQFLSPDDSDEVYIKMTLCLESSRRRIFNTALRDSIIEVLGKLFHVTSMSGKRMYVNELKPSANQEAPNDQA